MRAMFTRVMAMLALTLALTSIAAAQSFPAKKGPVVDEAGIINTDTRLVLTQTINVLAAKTKDEIVVVTVKSLGGQDIDAYAVALGKAWQLGEPGKNNGALVLVADDVGKVAIQVGDGLRTSLTDAVISAILTNRIVPQLRANNMSGGLMSGVDSMAMILTASFEDKTRGQPVKPIVVEKSPFDEMFGYFLLGLMGLFGSAFLIIAATWFGWLPEKRTGAWRILDAIVWLAGSIKVSSSSGSSSSSSGKFSGGGGTTGGGGASGSW